jgi:hypothetical protein
MLAVIQAQQEPPAAHRLGEGVERRDARLLGHADGRCHPGGQQVGLAQVREADQERAVGTGRGQGSGQPPRQPGLADAGLAAQRDQPRALSEAAQLGQVRVAPD